MVRLDGFIGKQISKLMVNIWHFETSYVIEIQL